MRDEALLEALEKIGGPARLATHLGISPAAVSQWPRVPTNRVLAVEAATGVRRERLRPDIYPPSQEAA